MLRILVSLWLNDCRSNETHASEAICCIGRLFHQYLSTQNTSLWFCSSLRLRPDPHQSANVPYGRPIFHPRRTLLATIDNSTDSLELQSHTRLTLDISPRDLCLIAKFAFRNRQWCFFGFSVISPCEIREKEYYINIKTLTEMKLKHLKTRRNAKFLRREFLLDVTRASNFVGLK